MKIYTSNEHRNEKSYLFLDYNDWDDYSIKSTFHLTLYRNGKPTSIGEVKVIDKKKSIGKTIFKDGAALPSNMCSLGQSVDYYKVLHRLGPEIERSVLIAMRDCAYDDEIYQEFENSSQFKASAIRFSTAEQALKYAQELFSDFVGPAEKASYSFSFYSSPPEFTDKYSLKFEFFGADTSKIPSNINVIIGRNGSGKTQLLSELAKAISGYGYDSKKELLDAQIESLPNGRPNFGNVIVVSYSAFDSFEIPGKTKNELKLLSTQGHIFGYKYCGLRERLKNGEYRIKNSNEIAVEFEQAIAAIECRGEAKSWKKCIRHVLNDPSFMTIKNEHLEERFTTLSSGQKIILSILAKVYEHIEPASVVIIDEPETHLHPSLMSAFMHSLRGILDMHDSYAIIATHSPVILQETPSRFVQVLVGNAASARVKKLRLESFGEEVSTLTEEVFGVSFEESNFYSVLQSLSEQGMSLEEVNRLFGKKIGLTARAFLTHSLG